MNKMKFQEDDELAKHNNKYKMTKEKTLREKPEINLEYKRGYDDGRRHRDIQWNEAVEKLEERMCFIGQDSKTWTVVNMGKEMDEIFGEFK